MEIVVSIEAMSDDGEQVALAEIAECLPIDGDTEDDLAALGQRITLMVDDATKRIGTQVMERRDAIAAASIDPS